MGAEMLRSTILCLLIGTFNAVPLEEMRSTLEFMDYSTNLDEPAYRLRDTIYPHFYRVNLDVDLVQARFDGFVSIDLEIREPNLTQIVFHQNVVSIQAVNVVRANGDPVGLQFPNPFTTDSYYELLLINLAEAIPVGNYTVSVRYLGQINTNPVDRGFYRGYYYYNNELRYYATTQFQPFHARKAFPCFDEPQFKSRFVISITRDSSLRQSYSNMAISEREISGTRTRETFFPTPIISAYLVAFHVSDFVETNYTGTASRPFGIISREGPIDQHQYAAEIGLEITDQMDDYFGILYHEMGQGNLMKNDHIALPDFPSGAMENWGMVNYREAYLLYDPQNTNLNNKVFIATIMAHELAHKWFGNLVTCFWWSNLWLNESFASFFEYFGAHYADPSLELDDQFVVDYVHSALTADAGSGAAPMNWTAVVSNPSISAHFSTTSYAKGASVLRMMEHFIGFRTFRNALRYYLRDNAYDVGTPEDLYAALRQATSEDHVFRRDFPNVDAGEVLDSWVQTAGSPVVNVVVNNVTGVISLTQERFLVSGTPEAQLWQIPITWTDGVARNFSSTRPTLLMTSRTATINGTAGQHWVLLNIDQSGLYRVNYDDRNWGILAAYLRTNRANIPKLNRAQIVNDVLFFIRAGTITTSRAFDVLSFLASETDYYVWSGAITQFDWIRRRLEHLPGPHTLFTEYLLDLLDTVINNLGYNERATDSTSTILNRMQIMNLACNLGHAGCISDSLAKWTTHRNNDTQLVAVNARRYVYCTGIREGDSTDYEFLFQKYNASENTADMVVILRTLACTRNATLLTHYLEQSMYNDKIRIHDRTNAFNYALQGNPENLPVVLDFLYQNFATIRETYGGEARLTIAVNALPAFLTDFATIREFQTWVYANQIALAGSFSSGVSAVTTAMNNLQWGNAAAPDIFNVLLERSSSAAVISSFTVIALGFIVQMLM